MIELIDPRPSIQIEPAEYRRLLGYPPGAPVSDRARELSEWARDWYADNGKPWIYARQTDERAMLAAVSAGAEVDDEAQRRWREDKPDEGFFLDRFGAAVVERLIAITGERLCAWAEPQGMAILPHRSPGYEQSDLTEQRRLLDRIGPARLPGPLEALESGALRPGKSLLAVFALTSADDRARLVPGMAPCRNCSLPSCGFRRAPRYTVNTRALRRWAADRLSLTRHNDGVVDARFLYEGTTCTNTGRPLAFEYHVKLGPPQDGYRIREQRCTPAPGDTGHRFMCQFSETLLADVASDAPLLGRPLREALEWQRPFSAAACYCDPASREHKWGLVLETIQYALDENR